MSMLRYGNLLLVLVTIACLAVPSLARQKMMLPEVSRFFKSDYSIREVDAFEAVFGLDAQQKLILETLLQDYEMDFLTGVMNLRNDLTALQPLPADVQSAYDRERETIRKDLEVLLQSIQDHQSGGKGSL